MEEVDSSDYGPKHLVFRGSNARIAKSNAGGEAGSRDVFRQSHLKEAEHMGSFSGAHVGQRTLKTMANLTQVGRATCFQHLCALPDMGSVDTCRICCHHIESQL